MQIETAADAIEAYKSFDGWQYADREAAWKWMFEAGQCAGDGLHDKGPWTVSDDGRAIESDDFTHDVILRVAGDFFSDEQRKAYAENLAAKLNAPRMWHNAEITGGPSGPSERAPGYASGGKD